MKKEFSRRAPVQFRFAVLVGLATVVGLGMPGLVSASEPIVCDAPPLIAQAPQAGAQLGWSMAIQANGPWLAVGANLADADSGRKDSGLVALYLDPQPGARPTQEIPNPDLHANDQFGSAVSVDSDWLAVGAPAGDGRVQDSGVVYLFQLISQAEGPKWVPGPKLAATAGARGDQFGFSVSLSGKTLVVGAPGDSGSGTQAGAAYVFELGVGGWKLTKKLLTNDGRPFDKAGSAVATDGDEIVVGAPFADDLTVFKNTGAAYVFHRDSTATGGWAQEDKGKLTAGAFVQGHINIQFGAAVGIRGERIVVGAPGDDDPLHNLTDSGSAYVFERSGPDWVQQKPVLTADIPRQGAQFGTSVLIDDKDRVLIGARFDSAGSRSAGAAYLFEKQSNGSWLPQIHKFIRHSVGGAFGQSVAIFDNTAFMGGFQDDVGTEVKAGAVARCPFGTNPLVCPSITKTDHRDTVCPGDTVTYEITVANAADHALVTGAGVADDFRSIAQLQGVTWFCTPSVGATCSHSGTQTLKDTVSLPAGGKVEYRVTAKVAPNAEGTITNRASVTLPSEPTSCAVATDTTRIPGDLGISMTGPTQVAEGDTATYSVVVNHSGAAMTGVKVKVEVTGGTLVDPPCAITAQGCSLPDFSAGPSSVPLEFKVQAPGGCPCPSAPIAVTATVTADERECDESNNTATAMTGVTCTADLELQTFQVTGPAPPDCGTISYEIDYKNLGPGFACNTLLDQSIPVGLTFVGPGSCQIQGSNLRCTGGNLPPGGAGSFQTKFAVPAICQGPIDTTATVSSTTPDPDPLNNSGSVETHCSNVRITKTDNPDPVVPGQKLDYDIKVENTGDLAVSGSVVEDNFPAELRHVLWCRGVGCTPTLSPPLKDTVDLAAGEAKFYRLSGIVQPMCSAVIHNIAKITPPAGVCDDPSDNQAIEYTQVVANGVLAFCEEISGPLLQFTAITKTFLLLNCGPANQADNPGDEFTDVLPPTLALTGASATSGVASTSGNTATWNGAIPVGGTVTINITATILAPAGTICNQATIAFDADGDGINESIRFSDDPDEPGPADPCCIIVIPKIPALSPTGLAALVILLACVALLRLRRRVL